MEEIYRHKVNYYETDAMGITHHSNYVRWMEEARADMMDKLGYSYKRLEKINITSPVLSYNCNIKHSTCFDDVVEILAKISKYNGVRLTVEYIMKVEGRIVATGETSHCFINEKGMPIRLNKDCAELDLKLKSMLEENIDK